MLLQLFPFLSQRCQRYANVIGLVPDQAPLAAVRVSPARGVPETVGSDVFAGAARRAPCAEPPARSASAAATPTYLHMSGSFHHGHDGWKVPQTKCLPGLEAGYFSRHAETEEERWDRSSRRRPGRSWRRARGSSPPMRAT